MNTIVEETESNPARIDDYFDVIDKEHPLAVEENRVVNSVKMISPESNFIERTLEFEIEQMRGNNNALLDPMNFAKEKEELSVKSTNSDPTE